MTRHRLANRREADVFPFEHDGRKWTASFGRFDDGRLAEVFLDAAKESPLAEAARESALLASLALQHGRPLDCPSCRQWARDRPAGRRARSCCSVGGLPMTSAERTRAYRERRRQGSVLIRLNISAEGAQALQKVAVAFVERIQQPDRRRRSRPLAWEHSASEGIASSMTTFDALRKIMDEVASRSRSNPVARPRIGVRKFLWALGISNLRNFHFP
jgi:hypothetical protein